MTNSLSGGGAERATNILVNALTDLGLQVSLVAVNSSARDLIEPKCQTFELRREWQGGFVSVLVAYFKLQSVIWKWKPNYLVLNCDIPELLGSLSLGKHKLIAVEHATFPWINRILLGKVTRKILSARNTKWVAVSKHLKIWGVEKHPDIAIHNAMVTPKVNRSKPIGQITRLNYVGRLSREKQPLWALEIAHLVNLPLRIFGEGLLRTQLEDFGIENEVETQFAGFVSNPWESFNEGDLLIVPSSFEGDGLVVVEALSNRIPIIANDIPDLRRFNLEDQNYAAGIEAFAKSIALNLNTIEHFVPNKSKVDDILIERNPAVVGQKWKTFLNSLT